MKTTNRKTTLAPRISVGCPNGHTLRSIKQTNLAIPGIPEQANKARVFNNLKTGYLLSIGQLCDSDCTAIFSKEAVKITNANNKEVLTGPRDKRTGLWTVDIPLTKRSPTKPSPEIEEPILVANGVIRAKTTKSDLAQYHYASLGNPATSTLLSAIKKGFLKSFPGLDEELIKKHLPKSIESSMGHLNQSRQNTQSTSVSPVEVKIEEHDDDFILPVGPGKTNEIMAAVHDISHRDGAAFGDLAGRYPIPSSKGNNYILVIYSYDSNAILAEPMKTRSKGNILQAYRKIHIKLVAQGLMPRLQMLNNETSTTLLDYLKKNKINVQLAPPHMHRRNLAEHAIRTFKEHFISIRAGCDPRFPKPTYTSSFHHIELINAPFEASSKAIGILTCPWRIRLQSHATSSCRHASFGT